MPRTSRKLVTIDDVARSAGVSPGTVSRVLNRRQGSIPISEETRTKVIQIANRLGYQANPFASALRTRRSGLLGAIIRDIRDPFLSQLVRHLQIVSSRRDVELLIGHADYDLATAGRQINRMRSHLFDGLILIGDIPGDVALIDELKKYHTPFISVARGVQEDTPYINIDEKAGVHLALDYLHSLGHRRIAYLGKPDTVGLKARLAFFEQYAQEHNLFIYPGYINQCENVFSAGASAVQVLLSIDPAPTAVFCATDQIALGALNGVIYHGRKTPQDLSIIGFDNLPESAVSHPRLTTIAQPVELFAEKAMSILFAMLEGEEGNHHETSFLASPTLVVRESCAPLSS